MSAIKSRIEREKNTINKMLHIYCKKNHRYSIGLCNECQELLGYAFKRLDNCRFGEEKSTCGKCPIHCYNPEMRKRVVEVMKFSGPRMIYSHPILAFYHLLDGVRK